MSILWLIEDSPTQLQTMQSLLTKIGHTVHAFRDKDEFLRRIADLPFPQAVVVDLALKGTSNGFQVAEAIRKLRPEIAPERFCFISGWKKSFIPMIPPEFRDIGIIDKDNWTLEELQAALNRAIKIQESVSR